MPNYKGHLLCVLMGISRPELWDISVMCAMTITYQVGVACNHRMLSIYVPCCAVWFEPTGVDKAVTAVKVGILDKFHYVSPNLSELRIIYESVYGTRTSNSPITGNYCLSALMIIIYK